MSDVQTNEPKQTQIDNQNVKTDDDASKYSSTTLQTDNRELDQTTTSNESTHDNPSTVESKATTNTTKPSTSEILDSDAKKQSLPSEVQPDNTTKPSETQIPESDANKQSSPTEVPSVNTTTPSASQIPETDANKQSPPTEVQPINTQETVTTQDTSTTEAPDSSANKQPLPTEVQQASASTPQLPDSGTNKQATTVPTHDSGESSNTKDVASNKEIASGHDTDSNKADSGTDAKDAQNDEDKSESQPTVEQERKQLKNLINQELGFVERICPKLGEHQEHITKEVKDAFEKFNKFDEATEIKELKDLKKTVTKLKLQIPAKYRTYDESGLRKKHQSDVHMGDNIPLKLLKRMPRLHNEFFNKSQFCKTIQKRYSELTRELKICLLCFSVFPENEIISRRLMVYWWIGEGLTPADEDLKEGETAEDHANGIFNELMEKDFIEPVSKNPGRNVATCKMHPMVRAALIIIADKIKFFDFDVYGDPKDFGKFDEIDSPEEIPNIHPLGDPREFFDFFDKNRKETGEKIEFVDKNGNPTEFVVLPPNKELEDKDLPLVDSNGKPIDTKKKYYICRRKKITTRSYKVCLMGSGLSKGIKWEKLHMLFNVKDDILEFKREWFLRMENVNVVFLGRWKSSAAHHIEVEEFDFKASLDKMNHVRFFSLQGVSRITELPKSISKLESLIILDLRACHNLEKIPDTIGSLNFLTHLDMSECYLLKDIPREISDLASLQVLKGFVVVDSPQSHVCTLQDLEKLKNLIKLSMYTHMKDFPRESHLEALQKFEMLRKLTILWGGHETKHGSNQSETMKTDKMKGRLASLVRKYIIKKNPRVQGSLRRMKAFKPGSNQSETIKTDKMEGRLASPVRKNRRVQGSLRRMNAFSNSTLGSRLEKLDLKCFPSSDTDTPIWLTPAMLQGLKKLYIRGGQFSDLGQYQHIYDVDDSPIQHKQTWNVEVLRLKYLDELKMEWRELQNLFPKMASLEKVKCPKLTLFPCNERGIWNKETTTT